MSTVQIADLKAHLSQHLRAARRGETVTVLDRNTPIAQLVPYDGGLPRLRIRVAKKPFASNQRPEWSGVSVEILAAALDEERQRNR